MDTRSIASRCKELLQFLASTKGDLANVTGPPGMLAPSSVVEVGHCWAQRPAVFAAPALEPDAARRCLLVLRLVLIALRSQVYVGGSPQTSIRKPLNAFLGELFLADWTDAGDNRGGLPAGWGEEGTETEAGAVRVTDARHSRTDSASTDGSASTASDASTAASLSTTPSASTSLTTPSTSPSTSTSSTFTTRLVAEQVSHHPPITAMHLADETHGVRADGYARVEITFAGAVQVRQIGHAVVHVDRYDEDYLVPLPDVRVRGFLSGRLYPEILGTYHIVASSGYTVEIVFSGQGFAWGGTKNAFSARVLGRAENKKKAAKDKDKHRPTLYTVQGVWSEAWTTTDARTGQVLERYVVDAPANAPVPLRLPPVAAQDPWESRRAWAGVLDGIARGDLAQTVAEKTRIEQAQRRLRAREAAAGTPWQPLLFRSTVDACPRATAAHGVFHRLAAGLGVPLHDERTKGVWRVDEAQIKDLQRPFHGTLTPMG